MESSPSLLPSDVESSLVTSTLNTPAVSAVELSAVKSPLPVPQVTPLDEPSLEREDFIGGHREDQTAARSELLHRAIGTQANSPPQVRLCIPSENLEPLGLDLDLGALDISPPGTARAGTSFSYPGDVIRGGHASYAYATSVIEIPPEATAISSSAPDASSGLREHDFKVHRESKARIRIRGIEDRSRSLGRSITPSPPPSRASSIP